MIRFASTSRMGRAYGDLENVPPELLTASHAASNAETRILISSGSNEELFNMGVIDAASPLPLIPVCAFTAEPPCYDTKSGSLATAAAIDRATTTPIFKVRLQQGFTIGEMGLRVSLHGTNFGPLMSGLDHKRTSAPS
jgi:hypothetical protein